MLPAERRQVGQQRIGDVFDLSQSIDGAFEISGVPKDDRGYEKVEAGGAVLLIFVCAVADFAEPADKNCRSLSTASTRASRKPQVGLN